MPDTMVVSTTQSNMRDYPLWLQAPSGEASMPYSIGDLRMLLVPPCPTAGVVAPTDFVVTAGSSPGTVTVTGGVGVTSPTGLAGTRVRERYLFTSDGPVDVPVYANAGTAPRYHRLVAQVNDEQLAMGATASSWVFRLIQDTGTPPTTNGANAIALATVQVNPGQGSGYTVTDLRTPCVTELSCALQKTSIFDLNVNTDSLISWSGTADAAGGGDPWHLYDNASSSVHIRDSGLYDLTFTNTFSGITNGTTSGIECILKIRKNGADIASGVAKQPPSGVGGLTLRAHVQGEYLVAGDVLTCYASYLFGTATTVDINGGPCTFRVARREYRP